MNYKANKDFLKQIKSCEFSGRKLKEMMEARFKLEYKAGYNTSYIHFVQLDAKLEEKYGNNIFACILSTAPSQINVNWKKDNSGYYHILNNSDKAFMERYNFINLFNISGWDYDSVMNLFEDYLKTMNMPLVVAA